METLTPYLDMIAHAIYMVFAFVMIIGFGLIELMALLFIVFSICTCLSIPFHCKDMLKEQEKYYMEKNKRLNEIEINDKKEAEEV